VAHTNEDSAMWSWRTGFFSSLSDVSVASITDTCTKAETSQSPKLGNLDEDLSDGGRAESW
jgi:hypothetical protein